MVSMSLLYQIARPGVLGFKRMRASQQKPARGLSVLFGAGRHAESGDRLHREECKILAVPHRQANRENSQGLMPALRPVLPQSSKQVLFSDATAEGFYFRLDGAEVVARLKPQQDLRPGARLRLALDMGRASLFDPESEKRIL
jgi:hypothetical protein